MVDRFGATSSYNVTIRGRWVYDSVKYSDQLIRVVVDLESTADNRAFMVQFKETLKERFQQADIYITAHELEVI